MNKRGTVLKIVLIMCLVVILVSGLLFGCAQPSAPAPAPAPKPTASPAPAPAPSPTPVAKPAQKTSWKCDVVFNDRQHEFALMKAATDKILERSGGRLEIQLFPNLSLGFDPKRFYSNLRDNACESVFMWNVYGEGEEPSFVVPALTGIWSTVDQVRRAANAIDDFKRKVYDQVWDTHYVAKGGMIHSENQILTRDKPINRLSDIKGLKIRVGSARFGRLLQESGGGAAQFLPGPEMYMALKTGVIDGAAQSVCYAIPMKLDEVTNSILQSR